MDIIKLRCFIAVIKCRSFSSAADELNISQSSLSKHIMALEKKLGLALFERRGRTTAPTMAGEELSKHASRILSEYDIMTQKSANYRNTLEKTVSLGIAPMGCQFFWIKRINEIMKGFPKYKLEFLEREELDLIALVTRKELDYIIIRKEILPPRGFRIHPLLLDKAVVILPQSHQLAKKSQIALDDLKNENLIFMDESTAPYKIFTEACVKAGFTPRIVRTAKTETVMLSCIGAGEGISLYFESDTSFFSNNGNVRLRPLADEIASEIVLAAHAARKAGAIETALYTTLGVKDKTISDTLISTVFSNL